MLLRDLVKNMEGSAKVTLPVMNLTLLMLAMKK